MTEEPVLARLMMLIQHRRSTRPAHSYTTQLLGGGVERIGSKVLEEAAELVEAAKVSSDVRAKQVVHEAADLVYHILVLLAACELDLSQVEAELARRFGVSGLDEKASRPRSPEI
jgi:phosphoribosyl-ATP pyrophosphohydrolase